MHRIRLCAIILVTLFTLLRCNSWEARSEEDPGTASPPTVEITVDPAHVLRSISPLLIGANVVYPWEEDAYWAEGRMASALRDLDLGFLRYPGGEVTSYYHWEDPNGYGWKDAWDPEFDAREGEARWMSFEEYMVHVRAIGATPLVGINVESGIKYDRVEDGVAEAVAFVQHAKKAGYDVEYWFIDNESYHDASHVQLTPEEYARAINRYAPALREVDPDIKLVANWKHDRAQWKTILTMAGKNIDLIDIHRYWRWGNASFEKWVGPDLMTNWLEETYVELIQFYKDQIRTLGLDAKVGFFEWSAGPLSEEAAPVQRSPYQISLINAEMLMQYARGGLDAATYWPLHLDSAPPNERGLFDRSALDDGALKPMPTYKIFRLFKEMLGQRLIRSTEAPGVVTMAALEEDGTVIIYVLRKVGSEARISLEVSGGRTPKRGRDAGVEVTAYRAPKGDVSARDAVLQEQAWSRDPESGSLRFTVAPFSLVKVRIER